MWRLFDVMFDEFPWTGDERREMIGLMWDSIAMAWIGTLIAAVFAVPLSFLAAENLVGRPIAWVTRQVFNILRAVPEVILALLFVPVFGLSPMAGVLAIGVGSIGSLGKLFYEIIENIQRGPIEATDAVGALGRAAVALGRGAAGRSRSSPRSCCTASRSTSARRPCSASSVPAVSAELWSTRSGSRSTTRPDWRSSW